MQPIAQCHGCKAGISPTVSYLNHKSRSWHAECFKCSVCHVWLVDGQFNELDDTLMCNPCYVEKVSKKCTACGKSVVSKGVQFGLNTYHPDCFVCAGCGEKPNLGEKVKEVNGGTLVSGLCTESRKEVLQVPRAYHLQTHSVQEQALPPEVFHV